MRVVAGGVALCEQSEIAPDVPQMRPFLLEDPATQPRVGGQDQMPLSTSSPSSSTPRIVTPLASLDRKVAPRKLTL